MSKITKLKIHQNKADASKVGRPMKCGNSGIVTTVVLCGCICITCCNLVNWEWHFVYCAFESLLFYFLLLENFFQVL